MKKYLISIILLTVLLLSSCQKEEEILKIGFSATLTGENANVGKAELYGAEIAVNEINAVGGINGMQLELVVKDDKADPDETVKIDNTFISEGIHIVIGHALSVVSEAMMENAKDKEILFLSPSIGTDALSNIDDNLIRNVATTYQEGKSMTLSIVETEPSKILLIQNLDNEILTRYHKEAFIEVLEDNDFTTEQYKVIEYHSNEESDIVAVEQELLSNDYDAVMIVAPSTDGAKFVNYVKINNIDTVLHLSSWAGIGLIDNIDTVDTNEIYVYQEVRDESTEEYIRFKETYEELYDYAPNMVSSNAYDMIYLLKYAIEEADSTNIDLVKEAILQIGDYEGIAGDYSINEYGDCIRESIKMVISDGEYVQFE